MWASDPADRPRGGRSRRISGSNVEYRVPQYYLWSVPVAGIVGMAVTWRALTERWRPESGQTA